MAQRTLTLLLAAAVWLASVPAAAARGPGRFSQVAQRAAEGVLALRVTSGGRRRHGNGFVARADGLLVCASMTVERGGNVDVLVDGTWQPARVVAINKRLRAALVSVAVAHPLAPLPVAPQAQLMVDRWIVAVGRSPGGEPHSMAGMVHQAPRRQPRQRPGVGLVDVAAKPGTPLLDLTGRVVGMSLGSIGRNRARAVDVAPLLAFLRQAAAGLTVPG